MSSRLIITKSTRTGVVYADGVVPFASGARHHVGDADTLPSEQRLGFDKTVQLHVEYDVGRLQHHQPTAHLIVVVQRLQIA